MTKRRGYKLFWTEELRKQFRILCLKKNTSAQAELERLIQNDIKEGVVKKDKPNN
jgi:hypothetical protein